MKIVIVGDGKVGHTLAEQLSFDGHDIVIIDKNAEALRRATEHLDVMCVRGNGIRGIVLREAGAGEADIVIAATSTDEMNMVCCLTAKKLGAKYTVARIRDPEYARDINMLKRELGIDMVINPEQATAAEISRLLRFQGASAIELFVRGRVEMVGFVAVEGDLMLGSKLSSLRRRLPDSVLFCACERDGKVIIPHGDTVFHAGDRIYVIGEPMSISHVFRLLGRSTSRVRDVLIVGGGRIARYLSSLLIKLGMGVKLIEISPAVAASLAEDIPEAIVINADGTDIDVLDNENMSDFDAFVALTNRDEDNLMISLGALQGGVKRVVAKSNRQNYNGVVSRLGLDCVVSPKLITADQIIHLVRGMQNSEGAVMETLYRIVGGKAEAMEFLVRGGTENLGVPIKDLRIKKGVLIGVIVRRGRIIIPSGGDHIEEGDSLILVCKDVSISGVNDIFDEV